MSRFLAPLDSLARRSSNADARKVGGKAARLAWLSARGFPVPPTWVLSAEAFTAALRELPPGFEPRSLLRASSVRLLYARTEEARQAILHVKLPKGLREELEELWNACAASSPWGLAVRSSATCEDGAQVSLAGLADTRLGVRGADELVEAVRFVWASIASGRAMSYLAAHGVRDVSMAVVIQRVVPADSAGVLFTQSPLPQFAHERVVNASFGLGAPIVSGELSPDVLRIAKDGEVLERSISEKPKKLVVGPDGGLVLLPVAEAFQPSLSDAQIAELSRLAAELERREAGAWDVEFACEKDLVWIVQARPVTGRGFPEGGSATTMWTNANVGEALPGVATPLTWSVAGAFSEKGFRTAFATLGCSVPKNAKLVGNVYGRFYLNVSQFLRIASQVPWLDPRVLVGLGGVSGGDALPVGQPVSRRGFYARLPLTASRLLREQMRLDDMVARFEAGALRARSLHRALDPGILPDEGLARSLLDIQGLLERTGTVMLTCASSALGAFLVLRTMLERTMPDEAERFAQDLTSGIRDLESARPGIAILRIMKIAKHDPAAVTAFDAETPWASFPEGATKRAIQSFLELYGDRAVREAELSTPRWRDDPTPVLTMIRVGLRGDGRDADVALARAERTAVSDLAKVSARLGMVEQTLLRHLVARAQRASRLREQMRSWVTTVLGMIRDISLEAERRLVRLMPELERDRELVKETPAASIESVFFLTVEELVGALRTSRTDLGPVIRARRAEYIRDVQRPEPPGTFTGAPPPIVLPPLAHGSSLTGVAASAGAAEGRARVLFGPEQMGEFIPGEILVVRSTDVGWTPLFLLAAGVVTELGGALSHAAIVAREFGVPTVVNVTGATRVLRTGERVRVDGDRGRIDRLGETSVTLNGATPGAAPAANDTVPSTLRS
jgi:rifampicin phosphotransferase